MVDVRGAHGAWAADQGQKPVRQVRSIRVFLGYRVQEHGLLCMDHAAPGQQAKAKRLGDKCIGWGFYLDWGFMAHGCRACTPWQVSVRQALDEGKFSNAWLLYRVHVMHGQHLGSKVMPSASATGRGNPAALHRGHEKGLAVADVGEPYAITACRLPGLCTASLCVSFVHRP